MPSSASCSAFQPLVSSGLHFLVQSANAFFQNSVLKINRHKYVLLTRRQALLDLIRLVRVFQDQRVEEAVTPDLELDLVRLRGLLDASG